MGNIRRYPRNNGLFEVYFLQILLSSTHLIALDIINNSTTTTPYTTTFKFYKEFSASCPIESHLDEFIWSSDDTNDTKHIVSNPLCLDESKFLLTRSCVNNAWIPVEAPHCAYSQVPYKIEDICPPGMTNILGNSSRVLLCVRVFYSNPWHSGCDQFGSTRTLFDLSPANLTALFAHLRATSNFQVWLPARWAGSKSIRWMLPGMIGYIKTMDMESIIGQPRFEQNGCLLMMLVGNKFVLSNRNCQEAYPLLCLYTEDSPLLQLACPHGFATARYNGDQTNCYSLDLVEHSPKNRMESPSEPLLYRINSVEKLFIAEHLFIMAGLADSTDQCLFNAINELDIHTNTGLSLGTWHTVASSSLVPFVAWKPNTNFYIDSFAFLVTNPMGEWTFTMDFNCILRNVTIPWHNPVLHIDVSYRNPDCLDVIVSNTQFIWHAVNNDFIHCFHAPSLSHFERAISLIEVYIVEDLQQYELVSTKPGVYWCEMFSISPISHIVSKRIHVDGYDSFTGSVMRKCRCLDNFINLTDWMQSALENVDLSMHLRIKNVQMLRMERLHKQGISFVQIWFRASLQYLRDYMPYIEEYAHRLSISINLAKVMQKEIDLLRILREPPFYFPVVNSTEYCLPKIQGIPEIITLNGARIGEKRTPNGICLLPSGLPVLLECRGSEELGLTWVYVTDSTCSPAQLTQLTQELHSISQQFEFLNQTYSVLNRVHELTYNQTMCAFDVFTISNIMERAATLNADGVINEATAENMLGIYDRLMSIEVNVTRASAQLNATNMLLVAMDSMLSNYRHNAKQPFKNLYIQTYVLNPEEDDFTGIALFSSGQTLPITKNQAINELLDDPDLVVATYLPAELLAQLPRLSHIVLNVFTNDRLFQANDPEQPKLSKGTKIISISIPYVDTSHLPIPIPVFFRFNVSIDQVSGGYWVHDNHRSWMKDGMQFVTNTSNVVQFNVSHLTNFALLIRNEVNFDPETIRALAIITFVGGSLSLTGIVGILITAARFPLWRLKASNQLLIQLALALALMLILFFVLCLDAIAYKSWLCITLGALLHYLVLVTFMWMLIMAYLQFFRYVIVFIQIRSERYVLKLSMISWLLPIVPVFIVLLVNSELYTPAIITLINNNQLCYPSGPALIYAVFVPIAIIVCCNLLIFCMVIYNLLQIQKTNRAIVLAQMRVSVFLFFLFGLTWIFGFLSQIESSSKVFTYLFCTTATLQGFVLFVYFVVLEPGTRKMWVNDVKTMCGWGRRGSMSIDMVSRQT